MFSGIGGFRRGLEKTSKISIDSQPRTGNEGGWGEPYLEGGDGRTFKELCGGGENGLEQANHIEKTNISSEKFQTQSRRWIEDKGEVSDRYSSKPSGKGGKNSGEFCCVWANDIDKYACQVYRKNFGDRELVEGDIRAVDPSSIPDFDLLTAGFPCQSFSVAGRRKGFDDTRGTLFYEILRVAGTKRPPLLLLENVKGLLNHDEGVTFQVILESLEELGYWVEWQVLNSKHFGVPQNRERVFVIGHLGENGGREAFPVFTAGGEPDETQGKTRNEGKRVRTANPLGVGGSFGERNLIANTLSHRYGKDGSENLIVAELRQSGFRQHRDDGLVPILTQKMGTGGNNVPMIMPVLTPDRENKRQHGRRFKDDGEESFTLTGQDIHGVALYDGYREDGMPRSTLRSGRTPEVGINGMRIRRLTPVECERLQGFPDNWTQKGVDKDGKEVLVSDTQRYKMLGNAVTTNVITFLGERVL